MIDPPDPGRAGDHLYVIDLSDEQDSPVDLQWVVRLAAHALRALDIAPGAELSLVLAEPARMAELKGDYMGERVPTDVLAFPMDGIEAASDEPHMLGDVVLCPEVARAQAAELNRRPDDEMALLLVHGVLHLLGHDHAEDEERKRMQAEERRILESFTEAAV